MAGQRQRVERAQGFALDALVIGVATVFATPVLQSWLRTDTDRLYQAASALHIIACPTLLIAVMMGHGKAGSREHQDSTLLGYAIALLWGGSFIIPAVLGLLFKPPMWLYMSTIFAPLVLFGLWAYVLFLAETRKWIAPIRVGDPKPWWSVQALGVIGWGYLISLELILLVASTKEGPLSDVGIPLGILLDYLPVRLVLYYIRDTSRWEVATMIASVLYLLVRIATT